jgi:glycosyltransferase involved in cell wall biosynthesis
LVQAVSPGSLFRFCRFFGAARGHRWDGRDQTGSHVYSKPVDAGKLVAVVVGDIWYSISVLPRILRRAFRALLRASFNRSSVILATSKSFDSELRDDYHVMPGKRFVYKYRIFGIFNPDVPRDLKNELNPFGPIVLTVARISPQKGLENLVEAGQTVVKSFPSVEIRDSRVLLRAKIRKAD